MRVPDGHRFYGAVTVGERGQIVIPQEARDALEINPGDKLLIFGGMGKGPALMVMKSEDVTKFVAHAMANLSNLEKLARESKE